MMKNYKKLLLSENEAKSLYRIVKTQIEKLSCVNLDCLDEEIKKDILLNEANLRIIKKRLNLILKSFKEGEENAI